MPLLNISVELLAFQISWPDDQTEASRVKTWKYLLSHHTAFDLLLESLPGMEGFISATTTLGADTPAIACFVMCDTYFSQRALCDSMKSHFPETTVTFLLQPFQRIESVLVALGAVIKDNTSVARRMHLYKMFTDRPCDPNTFSLVHFFATKEPERTILGNTAKRLQDSNFPVYIYQGKDYDNF